MERMNNMEDENMTEIEVEIDDELYAQIVSLAEADGVTVDEWVTEAVKLYLEEMIEKEEN